MWLGRFRSGRRINYSAGMASTFRDDPEHWLDRAREMRALAVQMSDPVSRDAMLDIAKNYEKLAERAAGRLRKAKK
jgi:hypothetical protein